jgi:hypothetical protein
MHFEQRTALFLSLITADFKSHSSKQESFKNNLKWKALIEQFAPPDMHQNVVLVGHKCDLEEKRKVTSDQGKKFADENGWLFFETSAKTGINVEETFLAAGRMGLRKLQFENTNDVRCRKFDSAAVFGPRWEVVWAKLHPSMLALGKTKEQALNSESASTFAISGSKCKIIDEYKGSHHILVFTPASHKVHRDAAFIMHTSELKIRNLSIFPSTTQERATIFRQVHPLHSRRSFHILHFNIETRA